MFRIKPQVQPGGAGPAARKAPNWLKILLFSNIGLVVLITFGLAGGYVIHQSDTNPNLCRTCHLMEKHVDSYLTSDNLDNVHARAGVECKDCHDYPVQAEIASGIKYITGDYDVVSASEPELIRRKFGDDMCLQCHISYEHIANQTDYLTRNPHLSHWPNPTCRTCHISHGEQVDYCSQCHENGGQRMTGDPIIPRAENPWLSGSADAPETPTGE